ncbi:MAG: Hsp70 family protein [Myxococcota bacterium]
MTESRFIVGIDLGTTHTVVAYADTAEEAPVRTFSIPQLVAPGEVEGRDVLPSVRFHAAAGTLAESDRALPWASEEPAVLGAFAERLGRQTPSRLVASAKSWLSHSGVDRTAPILPWGSDDAGSDDAGSDDAGSDVSGSSGTGSEASGLSADKVSPVDASASYLAHVRAAWDAAHPRNPLHTQEVILTVPASFDEGARALTLQAAKKAGLRVRLVEEPLAAFYRWLDDSQDELESALGQTRLALVVDVGGGTTDLTLLQVELRESGPRLTRIAVGEHLMLGGDNMDLAFAKFAEREMGKSLSAPRFAELVRQCRRAKETLLQKDAPDQIELTLAGGGSRLIGGTLKAPLSRQHVEDVALGGFFPDVELGAELKRGRQGIVEFGLPYVADPAVTRHVAAFLRRHEALAARALQAKDERSPVQAGPAVPDAVLFNGGVFHASAIAERMRGVLESWRGSGVSLLENGRPDLAVAEGAVAYGLARRGKGLRIGGGSARSYFLIVAGKDEDARTGVCVLPRGSEEGEEVSLPDRTFSLRVGRPVRFHLVSSTADVEHVAAGDVLSIDDGERYKDLPPIAAVLDGDDEKEVPVEVRASLTEIGTLEVSCIEKDGGRRWKMEQQLRGGAALEAARIGQLHPRFGEAVALVKRIYGKSKGQGEVKAAEVKRLRADLEKVLGPRESWETPLLRELFGSLLAGLKRRRRSADHERVWFHLVGYCLRPGNGYPLDRWRVEQLKPVLKQGLQFVPEAQNWSEFWIMWRRLAGGLDASAQNALMDMIAFYLEPPAKKPKPRPKGPKMLGRDSMVRLAGALEHLDADRKSQVGGWLVERLDKHDENPQSWWAVGRIGARVPFYGSAHRVVPPHVAMQWLERALTFDFGDAPEAAFAATLIARVSGDRQRDLDEGVRRTVAERLAAANTSPAWQTMVLDVVHLDAADERKIFGDSMPPGLRLLE